MVDVALLSAYSHHLIYGLAPKELTIVHSDADSP
jgi:hypothetical protein